MASSLRHPPVAVVLSLTLHVGIVAVLTAAAWLPGQPRVVSRQVAIEAMVVDESLVEREMARLEELEREEIRQREQEELEAREAAERERERLAELQRQREEEERQQQAQLQEQREREETEQQRLADLREQREREEREAAEAAERERERLAELQRQREEEERLAAERRAEEERQRQAEAEARAQAEREAELQRLLAAEEERRQAERAGLLDEYIRLIENRIQQNWIRPASATADLECVVNVSQIPSGEVVAVRVGECNGDDAVVQSIERAVLRASPLPLPRQQNLFERNLIVTFRPDV